MFKGDEGSSAGIPERAYHTGNAHSPVATACSTNEGCSKSFYQTRTRRFLLRVARAATLYPVGVQPSCGHAQCPHTHTPCSVYYMALGFPITPPSRRRHCEGCQYAPHPHYYFFFSSFAAPPPPPNDLIDKCRVLGAIQTFPHPPHTQTVMPVYVRNRFTAIEIDR